MTLVLGLAGLVLLFIGGDALVRGASFLALRLGLSPLAVGLTVVAFGTSTPELVVSLDAAFAGNPDIAVGNVVGSNIANLTLILGLAMVFGPARVMARTVRVDAPLVLGVSLVLVAMLLDGIVSRFEGAALFAALLAFTAITLRQGRAESPEVHREFAEGVGERPSQALAMSLAGVLFGLGGLVVGGHLFLGGAVTWARALGVTEAAIGLTVVAVGTSLPELVTSVVAARRGHGDIALGNVLGSNIFNVLGILGATALVVPLASAGITALSLWMMVGTAGGVAVIALTGRRITRLEGATLFLVYVVYVTWLLSRR